MEVSAARVLIVEDNRDTAELLRALLEDDYSVVLASSYAEALRAANGVPFDLFLFDVNLGDGHTGTELLRTLRGRPEYARTPAIACSAYPMFSFGRADTDGFQAYLRKPFEIDDLFAIARRLTSPA